MLLQHTPVLSLKCEDICGLLKGLIRYCHGELTPTYQQCNVVGRSQDSPAEFHVVGIQGDYLLVIAIGNVDPECRRRIVCESLGRKCGVMEFHWDWV